MLLNLPENGCFFNRSNFSKIFCCGHNNYNTQFYELNIFSSYNIHFKYHLLNSTIFLKYQAFNDVQNTFLAKIRSILFKKNLQIANAESARKQMITFFNEKPQVDRTFSAQFGQNANSCKYRKYSFGSICEEPE